MSNPGSLCPAVTSITCTMERGKFPADADPCYLAQKAELAMRMPRRIITKTGQVHSLKQLVMSSLIRIEEYKAHYLWAYKAEVVFAIADPVPLPMLATSEASKKAYGDNLPHSSNPFARPSPENWVKHRVSRIRRPDIILVDDPNCRWPGLGATYFDGKTHRDNLKMLIEVKFPRDTLSEGQRNDYILIATNSRFGVMRIEDNRTEKQKAYDEQYNAATRATAARYALLPPITAEQDTLQPVPIPAPPPEGAPGTLPQPLSHNLPLLSTTPWTYQPSVEDWVRFGDEVSSLAEQGWEFVRDSTREAFRPFGAWVSEKGDWLCQEVIDPVTRQARYTLSWFSDKTSEIITWTFTQIQALWKTVQAGMDITLDYLQQIDWVQILHDIGDGTVQLAIKVAEKVVTHIVVSAVAGALVLAVAAIAAAITAGTPALAALFGALAAVGGGTLAIAN
ncbi:VRR-NUC domain protein [Pectobacterium parmentieri WPP163]|uniref:VRR-NUC domain-containing protein n=1 Tax=Pectobacterium parmentieri TaxID=1905730 RepID=UPI0001B1192A|nr:VRR-NUC domain-containing protein [Pectobacterium parmentieri]ACX89273.1 VRR-NUC domain protein [Pectobacterium parmentieri WPP163]QHQ14430.1 VRR-NUC domain-containing protein [Pectobacterium parmentieri]